MQVFNLRMPIKHRVTAIKTIDSQMHNEYRKDTQYKDYLKFHLARKIGIESMRAEFIDMTESLSCIGEHSGVPLTEIRTEAYVMTEQQLKDYTRKVLREYLAYISEAVDP